MIQLYRCFQTRTMTSFAYQYAYQYVQTVALFDIYEPRTYLNSDCDVKFLLCQLLFIVSVSQCIRDSRNSLEFHGIPLNFTNRTDIFTFFNNSWEFFCNNFFLTVWLPSPLLTCFKIEVQINEITNCKSFKDGMLLFSVIITIGMMQCRFIKHNRM